MTVQALREFILGQGFSMSTNTMEWDKIWTINKRVIDPIAPRYTAITLANQAVLHLDNFDGDDSVPQVVEVALHPKNAAVGAKAITRSSKVILEQDDAQLIKEGEEVTLMNWGNVKINKLHWQDGVVTRLDGSLHLAGDHKLTEKKLTWIDGSATAAADQVALNFVELDTLVTIPKVEEGVDFESIVNPTTKFETRGVGEAALRAVKKGDIIQIARRGFFIVDAVPTPASNGAEASPLQLIFVPDGRAKQMSTLKTRVVPLGAKPGVKSKDNAAAASE